MRGEHEPHSEPLASGSVATDSGSTGGGAYSEPLADATYFGDGHAFTVAGDPEQLDKMAAYISELKCERAGLIEQYEGWVKLSHQLFNMIPREVWRDQGGDDGQGHYEGEYHAERIEQEIHAALASFPAIDPSGYIELDDEHNCPHGVHKGLGCAVCDPASEPGVVRDSKLADRFDWNSRDGVTFDASNQDRDPASEPEGR